ncbi:MAG: hypothetical protein ING19_00515 [Azospirillum sp.]|nr:hypothetical protein [Azospirillum sp.]
MGGLDGDANGFADLRRACAGAPMRAHLIADAHGDPGELLRLAESVRGPGFVDWTDVAADQAIESTIGLLLRPGARGGAESWDEAYAVARQIRDKIRDRIDEGRRGAELDPLRCPFDLQSIVSIPLDVLRAGVSPVGRAWMIENWGVEHPLAHVDRTASPAIEQALGVSVPDMVSRKPVRRHGRGRGRDERSEIGTGQAPIDGRHWVKWTFACETFPFPCLRVLMRSHPEIGFRVRFADEFGIFDRRWPPYSELVATSGRNSEPQIAAAD